MFQLCKFRKMTSLLGPVLAYKNQRNVNSSQDSSSNRLKTTTTTKIELTFQSLLQDVSEFKIFLQNCEVQIYSQSINRFTLQPCVPVQDFINLQMYPEPCGGHLPCLCAQELGSNYICSLKSESSTIYLQKHGQPKLMAQDYKNPPSSSSQKQDISIHF